MPDKVCTYTRDYEWDGHYANDNYAKFALEHHVARSPNLFVEYLDMTQWNLLLRTTYK